MTNFGLKAGLAVLISTCSCRASYLVDCDYVSNDLCVATDGFNVTPNSISWEINTVETSVNKFFFGLNLAGLIAEKGLQLEYLTTREAIRSKMADDRGIYYPQQELIRVQLPDNLGARDLCVETYYVLGHEMLHFIALRYLRHDAPDHDIDYLFLQPSIEKRGVANDNAEFAINVATERYCKALAEESSAS